MPVIKAIQTPRQVTGKDAEPWRTHIVGFGKTQADEFSNRINQNQPNSTK
jgi:hypothetical protein